MVHRQQRQLELVLLRQLLQRGIGFLAVGAVVEDMDDLLALQLLEPTLLVADVADDRRRLAPVVGREVEHPREPVAVGRRAHAVAHREHDDLVDRRFRDELVGDARAVGVDDHRAPALQALVALHPLLGVVLGLAFLPGDLDAVDAGVALVEQREVVDEPVGDRNAARRVGAGPVDQQRDEHVLALGGHRRRQRAERQRQGQRADPHASNPHRLLLSISAGTATAAVFPCRSARAARGRAAPRSERR